MTNEQNIDKELMQVLYANQKIARLQDKRDRILNRLNKQYGIPYITDRYNKLETK